MSAKSGVDYIVTSDRVTFADGEQIKVLPITLINSEVPRIERQFIVRLLNGTSGEAIIGTISTATVIIGKTFDANGVFGKLHLNL